MYTILVCDDEKDIVNAIKIYLKAEGYNVIEASNGKQALELLAANEVHLILMDIMMPQMDGIAAIAQLRENKNLPVIFLTAKSEDTDKVLGLNIGADDYVTKPFNPIELLARIKSQLRRYTLLGGMVTHPSLYKIGGIVLDDEGKSVTLDGDPISLTPLEYEILKLLMQNPGRVFSSAEIYKRVWKDPSWGAEGTVAVHIRHLREKTEINPGEPRYIKVVWGQGYKINA
ncbi:MAG: response regulator transcription factor [Eubacteriales bacterium]|jgi:DNA-binding response OmpR family regulator|nr:response regulator transcription factor [Eubacteriales bacterium]